jgi:hypothetical protein
MNENFKERSLLEQELTDSGYNDEIYDMRKIEKMASNLKIESPIDRRIVYEILGVKLNQAD